MGFSKDCEQTSGSKGNRTKWGGGVLSNVESTQMLSCPLLQVPKYDIFLGLLPMWHFSLVCYDEKYLRETLDGQNHQSPIASVQRNAVNSRKPFRCFGGKYDCHRTLAILGNENSARSFSDRSFFFTPLGSWTSAPSGHGRPHRNACFSRISRA